MKRRINYDFIRVPRGKKVAMKREIESARPAWMSDPALLPRIPPSLPYRQHTHVSLTQEFPEERSGVRLSDALSDEQEEVAS